MTAVLYFLLILPISLLPMSVLYRVSNLLYVLIFYVVRYRKKVVFDNLRRSFPEKSEAERIRIGKEFYRHFSDLIVESFKGFTISKKEINRRFKVRNPDALGEAFKNSKSAIIVGGHYNNWEWLAIAARQQILHRTAAIYKPLSNRFLEKKMRLTRGKFGLEMIPIKEVPGFFLEEQKLIQEKRTLPFAMLFGIDQSPGDPRKSHWVTFLGQDTGVPYGAEKYAREYDLPVFFGVIHKLSRGHYEFELRPLSPPPHPEKKGWILEQATALIENEIRQDPRFWLWTHRRWKHSKPRDSLTITEPS